MGNNRRRVKKDFVTGSRGGIRRIPLMLPEQRKALVEKISLVMENVKYDMRGGFQPFAACKKTVKSNTKYVSFVINETYGKSFKTYLNEYRIAEACRRLVDQDNYGNLQSGQFIRNSDSRQPLGFVAAFRKVIGMTPSEYKKMHSHVTFRRNGSGGRDGRSNCRRYL